MSDVYGALPPSDELQGMSQPTNPSAPTATAPGATPNPSDLLTRAQQLMKTGAISPAQYQQLAQKLQGAQVAAPAQPGQAPQTQTPVAQPSAQGGQFATGVNNPNMQSTGTMAGNLGQQAGNIVGKIGQTIYNKANPPQQSTSLPSPSPTSSSSSAPAGQPLDISPSAGWDQ